MTEEERERESDAIADFLGGMLSNPATAAYYRERARRGAIDCDAFSEKQRQYYRDEPPRCSREDWDGTRVRLAGLSSSNPVIWRYFAEQGRLLLLGDPRTSDAVRRSRAERGPRCTQQDWDEAVALIESGKWKPEHEPGWDPTSYDSTDYHRFRPRVVKQNHSLPRAATAAA